MLPLQQIGTLPHRCKIRHCAESCRIPFEQRMLSPRKIDGVAVGLFLCRTAGIERIGDRRARKHLDVGGQKRVEGIGNFFGRDLNAFAERKIADLPRRVHARIRPAAAGDADADAEGAMQGFFERTLHRPSVFLDLPAGKMGAVIADQECDIHFFAPKIAGRIPEFL